MKKLFLFLSIFINYSYSIDLVDPFYSDWPRKTRKWPSCYYFCCIAKCKCYPKNLRDIIDYTIDIYSDREDDAEKITSDDQEKIIEYIQKFIYKGRDINEKFYYRGPIESLDGKNITLIEFFAGYGCPDVSNYLLKLNSNQ